MVDCGAGEGGDDAVASTVRGGNKWDLVGAPGEASDRALDDYEDEHLWDGKYSRGGCMFAPEYPIILRCIIGIYLGKPPVF